MWVKREREKEERWDLCLSELAIQCFKWNCMNIEWLMMYFPCCLSTHLLSSSLSPVFYTPFPSSASPSSLPLSRCRGRWSSSPRRWMGWQMSWWRGTSVWKSCWWRWRWNRASSVIRRNQRCSNIMYREIYTALAQTVLHTLDLYIALFLYYIIYVATCIYFYYILYYSQTAYW